MTPRRVLGMLAIVVPTFALACSGGEGSTPASPSPSVEGDASPPPTGSAVGVADAGPSDAAAACAAITSGFGPALDKAAEDKAITATPDFTLLLETEDGRSYAHSHGASTATTVYESASTSKLVSAVVLLDLVDEGVLGLDTKAHDLLPFWTEEQVKLRDLLSFTSGFHAEPPCLNRANTTLEECVKDVYAESAGKAPAPGVRYQYSSTHLHVAGLMAMKAKGVGTWGAIFDAWKAKTKLFPTAVYDLPSATNPRLAGGMHWTATEYLGFLRALAKGEILKPATRAALFGDQRGSAKLTGSPAFSGLGEDWSYGFGNWLECPSAKQLGTFDCGAGHRNSSAGAYGAYPFIDFDHHYFGIFARQGALGTGFEGVLVVRAAEPAITQWADCR